MKVKRTLWILLALVLILGAGARAEGEPAAVVQEGSCGESLTWTLREDGVLTIAGSGEMKSYFSSSGVPWYAHRKEITGILLPEELTGISSYAFYECPVTRISIPVSVTKIGTAAFSGCSALAEVDYNGSAAQWMGIDFGSSNDPLTKNAVKHCSDADLQTFGSCGEALNWVYDGAGTLSVLGSGEMENYSSASRIPWYSFRTEITDLRLSEELTGIGSYAFSDCAVTRVSIPSSVKTIGSSAFYSCTALEAVTLPDSVEGIGKQAFSLCSALKRFAVPSSVTEISDYAFNSCYALEQVSVPVSVTKIGKNAFSLCSALAEVDYGGSLAQWMSIDVGSSNEALTEDAVKRCSDGSLQRYGSCGEALTWTYDGAGTLNLQGSGEMNAYASISYVPWYEFRAEITELRLPEELTGISAYAFSGCGVTEADIPASVGTVGGSAFASCTALERVAIPASVTEIGSSAFNGCSALTEADYDGSLEQWTAISIGSSNAPLTENAVKHCSDGSFQRYGSCGETLTWTYDGAGTLAVQGYGAMNDYVMSSYTPWFKLKSGITELRLPEGLTSIGSCAFSNCGMSKVTVPASVITIGSSAFASCAALESVTLPTSVTEIGSSAFNGCSALKEAQFGGSLAQWAGINILSSNAPLKENALKRCTDGETRLIGTCGDELFWWLQEDGVLTVSGSGAMSSRPWSSYAAQIGSIVLEEGAASLVNSAFSNCTLVKRVTIPASVTEIGGNAFKDCASLEYVSVPASVTEIGSSAFSGCSALKDVAYGGTLAQWTGIRIDSSGNTVLIDDAVKHCSDGDARRLGTCGEGMVWVYDGAGTLSVAGSGAVPGYSPSYPAPWSPVKKEITALRLPEGLTGIGDYAFSGCALTEAELPAGLTEIGQYAFSSCAALERVAVPASLTKIGANAFYGCAALTELSFGGEISDWARIDVSSYNSELDAAVKLCGPEQTAWLGAGPCGAEGADLIWMMDGEYDLTISGSGEMKDYQYSSNVPWKNAKTVTLTEGVTGICQQAFRDFTQLTKATLPESLREIGRYAFANTGLTEITIPAALTSIPNYAFQNCAALAKVTLTESLEEVLPWAFNGCSALTDVNFGGTWEQWQEIAVGGSNTPLSTAVKHCTDRELIAVGACGEGLSWELDGEGTLTVSGEGGMSSSTGWYDYRSAIRKVLLPEGLASVSARAFENCTELTEVRIPSGVTSIVSNPFVGCTSLTRIDVEEGNTVYWSRDGVLYGPYSSYDKSAALCCYPAGRPGRSFSVPKDVPVISSYAFSDCVFLEELVLPAGVARMEYNAVQNCPALSSATISHTVINIGGSALYNCPALTVRGYDGSEIEAYAQENGLAWESLGPIVYTEVYISYETDEDPSAALRKAVGQKYTHVVLGDGIYNTGMLIPNSEMIIEAEHPGKVEILSSDGSLPVISMSGVARENIELRGLILGHSVESGYQMSCMGPGKPGDPGGDVIYAAGVRGLVVENCDLWGCGIVGIRMYDCTGVEVRGCILRDCVESAVVFSGSEAAFENCVISGNAYSNQTFDCLRLSGDLSQLRFSDCLFINNRNPALTSAEVPKGFFDSCTFHDNVWQGLTPGTYGICLGGVTWEAVKTETGYRLRFGSAIACQDGAVLPGVSGEVPSYSRYSKPWKRLNGVQESEVTSPGARLRLPAGTEASTLRVGSAGLVQGRSYSVFYALYDENGRMFDLRSKQFTVNGELSSELLLEGQPAGTTCRVFLLDGFVPQTDTIQVQYVD